MAEYLVQDTSLTAVADQIRVLSGTTDPMGLDAMENHVGEANTDVATEASLIAQISSALEGKTAGGGESDGSAMQIATGSFNPGKVKMKDNPITISGLNFTPKSILIMVKPDTKWIIDYAYDYHFIGYMYGELFENMCIRLSLDSLNNISTYSTDTINITITQDGFTITETSIDTYYSPRPYIYYAFG